MERRQGESEAKSEVSLGSTLPRPGPGEFLSSIREAVLADPGPAGLKGCLRIGVAYPTGDHWLEVRLDGKTVEAGDPRKGSGVDVSLLIGDYEARRFLRGRALPHAPLFSVQGDDKLLVQFVGRYLRSARWSGLQSVPVLAPRVRRSS